MNNRNENDGWFSDQGGLSAVVIVNNQITVDQVEPKERGFIWLQIGGIRIYSCYCSPNFGTTAYTDFLRRLEVSIRATRAPFLVAGDFNAHSPNWGSPSEDARGRMLKDMISSTNLNICNIGNEPTFVRGSSRTHIDLTLASDDLIPIVKNWRVSAEEKRGIQKTTCILVV